MGTPSLSDKEYKQQKARVWKLFLKWKPILRLNSWDITLVYRRNPFRKTRKKRIMAARIKVQWEYLQANIELGLYEFLAYNDDEAEEIIVHELCHILVNEMRDSTDPKHEERVVTTLSKIFIGMQR